MRDNKTADRNEKLLRARFERVFRLKFPGITLEHSIDYPEEYLEPLAEFMWQGYRLFAEELPAIKFSYGFVGNAADFSGGTKVVAFSAVETWVKRHLPHRLDQLRTDHA